MFRPSLAGHTGRSTRPVHRSDARPTHRVGVLLLALCAVVAPFAARAAGGLADDGMHGMRPDSIRARHATAAAPGVAAPLVMDRNGPPQGTSLDGTWQPIAGPFDPPAVNRAPVVRDSRRHRMLLVDGEDFAALWSLSLPATGTPQWNSRLVAGPLPPARIACVAVYDSLRDRVVLHGGWDGTTVRSDTWTLALSGQPRWTQLLPSDPTSPARDGHVAIVDPVRDRLVIFGGTYANCDTCRSGEAWALPLAGEPRWTRIAADAAGPSPRTDASAVYDPWLDLMVVFGGWDGGPKDDVWSLRLSDATWIPFDAGRRPQARLGHVAVADVGHQRMIVQGGGTYYDYGRGLSDAWTLPLRGPAAWEPLPTTGPAPVAFYHGAIYSPERHSLVTYGGLAGVAAPNACFELDLDRNAWTDLSPADDPRAPSRRFDNWMMVDPTKPQVIVTDDGATDFRCYGEPWGYSLADTSGWKRWAARSIAPRCGAFSTVYDSRRDRLLSFGGDDLEWRHGRVDEISALPLHAPGAVWQPLPIAGPLPMGRWGMGLVYDAKRDRVLMFGGATSVNPSSDGPFSWDDLWQLSLGADSVRWTPLATVGTPGGRWQVTAMIDTLRDRLVLHGGVFTPVERDFYPRWLTDTWVLPLGGDSLVWQRLGPDAPAVAHPGYDDVSIFRTPVLDAARDRLLLVDTNLPAAYAMPFEQPTAWQPLAIARNAFVPRNDAAMALDPAGDRVFVFGGLNRGLARADLAALQLLPPTRQVAIDVALEGGGRGEDTRALRIAVHGSATFAVDSMLRAGATLNGARVHFDEGFGWHGERQGAEHRMFRDLVGHVALRELLPLPADSVVAFSASTRRGTRITGYTRMRLPPHARAEASPFATSVEEANGPVPGLRALGGPAPGAALAFEYALPSEAPGVLDLLDVQGRRVARREATVGTDGRGRLELPEARMLAPGVYLARLSQGARVFTARVVILR